MVTWGWTTALEGKEPGWRDRPGTEGTTVGQPTQGREWFFIGLEAEGYPASRHCDFPLRRGVMFMSTGAMAMLYTTETQIGEIWNKDKEKPEVQADSKGNRDPHSFVSKKILPPRPLAVGLVGARSRTRMINNCSRLQWKGAFFSHHD